MPNKKELLSSLPKVDSILVDNRIALLNNIPRRIIIEAIRETIDSYRENILKENLFKYSYDEIIKEILNKIKQKNTSHLKRVVNATGTVVVLLPLPQFHLAASFCFLSKVHISQHCYFSL
jgi:L-seryl-tRNA(Ser) seleniumtransferase